RLREVEEVIADVMAARRIAASPQLGPISASSARLAERLRAIAMQTPPSIGERIIASLRKVSELAQPRWVPVTAAILCVAVLVTQLLLPVQISAQQLMMRAEQVQASSPMGYQEVRIRFLGQNVIRRVARKRQETAFKESPTSALSSLLV